MKQNETSQKNPFSLSESEKRDILKRIQNDIGWGEDELVDSEQDVSNQEVDEDFESVF